MSDPLPTTVEGCDEELEILDLNLFDLERQLGPDVAPRIEAAHRGWRERAQAALVSVRVRRQAVLDRRAVLERHAARAAHAAFLAEGAARRAARSAAAAAERERFQVAFLREARVVLPPTEFAAVLEAVERADPGSLPGWAAKVLGRVREQGEEESAHGAADPEVPGPAPQRSNASERG